MHHSFLKLQGITFTRNDIPGLATLLERANTQNLKWNLKNLFYFLFCCNVGASDLVLKSVGPPEWGLYKKCT